MAAEPPAMSTCRVCHLPIRLVILAGRAVWGHETATRVGQLHPRHLARPERVIAR